MAIQTYQIMDIYKALGLDRQEAASKYAIESPDNVEHILRELTNLLGSTKAQDITALLREGKQALKINEIFGKLPFHLLLGCLTTVGEMLHRQEGNQNHYVVPDHLSYVAAGCDGGSFQANIIGSRGPGARSPFLYIRRTYYDDLMPESAGKKEILRALRRLRESEAKNPKIVPMAKEDAWVLVTRDSPLSEADIDELFQNNNS